MHGYPFTSAPWISQHCTGLIEWSWSSPYLPGLLFRQTDYSPRKTTPFKKPWKYCVNALVGYDQRRIYIELQLANQPGTNDFEPSLIVAGLLGLTQKGLAKSGMYMIYSLFSDNITLECQFRLEWFAMSLAWAGDSSYYTTGTNEIKMRLLAARRGLNQWEHIQKHYKHINVVEIGCVLRKSALNYFTKITLLYILMHAYFGN